MGWLDPRRRVPVVAIALQGVAAIIIALSGRYDQILSYVVSMDFLFFGLTATCLFTFRRRDFKDGRRTPEKGLALMPGHPVTTFLFVAASWLVVINTIFKYPHNTAIGFGILFAGIPVYFFWSAQKRKEGPGNVTTRREIRSAYLEWAKSVPHAKFNLATSGIDGYPLAELPVKIKDLEKISAAGSYGYPPLQERVAKKNGVEPECVVAANGTSMANHLAMAALLGPGDEVLIEQPTYEPLLTVAEYLGAKVRALPAAFRRWVSVHPREIERHMTPHTRLIVITNLHNPSGARTPESKLRLAGKIAQSRGAQVLVDEAIWDAWFDLSARSAFHLGPNFIVTSSLTKAFGLSGLRCGWILAAAPLAEQMWRLNDLYEIIRRT